MRREPSPDQRSSCSNAFERILPIAGASGGIEAIRNHVFRSYVGEKPCILTVSPGYWRAMESFQGLEKTLMERDIRVMWGSEIGLTDEYLRLETSAPRNVEVLVLAMRDASEQSGGRGAAHRAVGTG